MGVLLIVMGAVLWILALFREKIDDRIINNHLVTDGVEEVKQRTIKAIRRSEYADFGLRCRHTGLQSGE